MNTTQFAHLFRKLQNIKFQSKWKTNSPLQGNYLSHFKGKGIEFREVRAFQEGDEIRSIDWNVTARMGTPYVKEFQEERDLTFLIVVDCTSSTLYGKELSIKQRMGEASAILSFLSLKHQDRVGLLLFSEKVELYLPPKKGEIHLERIIREILCMEAKGQVSSLKHVVSFLGHLNLKKSTLFFLSDFRIPYKELLPLQKKHMLHFFHFKTAIPHFSGETKIIDLESNESKRVLFSPEPLVKKEEEIIKEISSFSKKYKIPYLSIEEGEELVSTLSKFWGKGNK